MTGVKEFKEFLRIGIVKRQNPDKSRAKFLAEESDQNYSALLDMIEKIDINELHANNYIKTCYDILMELTRAKMLIDGYNASGLGAHEAEISYLRILGFSEKEVQFADQLRFFRNRITYYGSIFDSEYALNVIDFLNKIYPILKKKINLEVK